MGDFAQKLRLFRVSKREYGSLDDFYEPFGVSGPTGSRYETGKTEPPLSFLQALSDKFGQEVEHLMPGVAEKKSKWMVGESQPSYVTGASPGDIQAAFVTLLEMIRKVKTGNRQATVEDFDPLEFGLILGKAAREVARGASPDEVRRELVQDIETHLKVMGQ